MGLLAGEAAVAVCAYLFSYALFMDTGTPWKKLKPLIPFAAITVVWRIIYVYFAFSVAGTSFYVDPIRDAAGFISAFLPRMSTMLLSQFFVAHAAATNLLDPELVPLYCASAGILLLVLGYGLKPLMAQPAMRFFALGTVLSIVPFCATLPDDRLLILPGFGAMGIIAAFMGAVVSAAAGTCFGLGLRRGLAAVFFVVHFLMAPFQFQINAFTLWLLQKPLFALADTVGSCPIRADSKIILVNAPMDIGFAYLPYILIERKLPVPPGMLLLSAGRSGITVTRPDRNTLQLHLTEGLLGGVYERIFRDDPTTIKPGHTIHMPDYTITVEGVTEKGNPADLRYVFREGLEAENLHWFCWTSQGVSSFAPPPVGASATIPGLPHFTQLSIMPEKQALDQLVSLAAVRGKSTDVLP